jgi:hypothetical protein
MTVWGHRWSRRQWDTDVKEMRPQSPVRKPRQLSATQQTIPSPIQPNPASQDDTSRTWKVMHHPDFSCHPEEDELIDSGEYWMFPWRRTTPLSSITAISERDTILLQPQTTIGKRGNTVKHLQRRDYFRRGRVVTAPHMSNQSFDEKDGWYVMNIAWDEEPDYGPICPSNACKTITEIL